jgi:hypothetical protein
MHAVRSALYHLPVLPLLACSFPSSVSSFRFLVSSFRFLVSSFLFSLFSFLYPLASFLLTFNLLFCLYREDRTFQDDGFTGIYPAVCNSVPCFFVLLNSRARTHQTLPPTSPQPHVMADYIIIGAGVFGLSTALYLAESDHDANIILIDRSPYPCPSAAASDLNKIVRADYPDIFYTRLALEALEEWNTNPLYMPYFHETGMLFAEDIGMGDASLQNYKQLGIETGSEILTPDQARERHPVFKNANWTDVKDNFYNPHSGWGEADPAVNAVLQAAVKAGVNYVQEAVEKLLCDDQGTCVGVKLISGDEMKASTILLCAGAWTAKLIADSQPHNKDLQVNGRMVAAAATSCIVQCDPEHQHLYRDAPVHFLGMSHTHGE